VDYRPGPKLWNLIHTVYIYIKYIDSTLKSFSNCTLPTVLFTCKKGCARIRNNLFRIRLRIRQKFLDPDAQHTLTWKWKEAGQESQQMSAPPSLQESQVSWLCPRPGRLKYGWRSASRLHTTKLVNSVAGPNPDPSDPYVFEPSGSGSFYRQAKVVRKTCIPTVLLPYFFLTFYRQKVICRKTFLKKLVFCVGLLKVNDENPDPHPDPNPFVRGMDPRIRIHTKMTWIRNTACKDR
jgi:hypothetical protein